MKTSIKTLATICTAVISLSLTAQRNHNSGNNQAQQPSQPQQSNQSAQNNNQNDKHGLSSNNHHPNWGGNVNIHVGDFPNNYGYNYGYDYNNNYYSLRKAARNSIRQSANVIRQALNFSDWNDTYSPWLAKAIRHQQYAKQLYFWGDYAGALNHAERSGFLAWNTLSYFNDPYGYNSGGGYPDPYGDPNNPYYRQNNPSSTTQPNTNLDEDYGYRKGSDGKTTDNNSTTKKESKTTVQQKNSNPELERSLPQSKLSDKELLKVNAKDLDID